MLKKEDYYTRKLVLASLFVANILIFVGCNNADVGEQNVGQSRDALINEFNVYKLKDIQLNAQELESRVKTLTGLMVKDRDLSAFTRDGLDVALEQKETLFAKPFQNAPDVFVSYNPERNKLTIENEDLTTPELDEIPEYEANPDGIGETNARSIMESFLNELDASRMISKSNYDAKDVRVAYYKTGRGPVGKPEEQTMWIDEYLFTLDKKIDGIRVYGDYIRIGVHRTGEVSSLRIAEMDISESAQPRVTRAVSTDDVINKFYSEIPWDSEAVILENQIAYVKQETDNEAVVEPVQLIRYTLQTPTKDGGTIASEVITKGYSLVSPQISSVDYSPAGSTDIGISDAK
jgi:hypothetical protein